MLAKENEAVSEGNGPVPQKKEFGSGLPTWGDAYPMTKEAFDRWDKKLDEISDEMRVMDEHVTRLEHGARQPRLAMKADEHASTKTQERTGASLQQYKRCVGIAVLLNKRVKMDRGPRSLSAWKPNLPISHVGKTVWSRTARRRPSRVFHPWRCAQQQLPVA